MSLRFTNIPWRAHRLTTSYRYEQLTYRSAELREELHTELERILKTAVDFKIHIQQSLEHYEEFVAEEVEREYEEHEQALASMDFGGQQDGDVMEE